MMPSRIEDVGLRYFLINYLYETYYNDKVLSFLIKIKNTIETSSEKKYVKMYLDNIQKEYEKILYRAKPHPHTTNELVNITSIWEFEMIPRFLKYIENMKRMIE